MDINKFFTCCGEFLSQNILPATFPKAEDSVLRAIAAGTSGVFALKGTRLIQQHLPTLKTLGIITDGNEVDIETVEAFINAAFADQERITVKTLPLVPEELRNRFPKIAAKYCNHTWTFGKSDAEKFLELLNK